MNRPNRYVAGIGVLVAATFVLAATPAAADGAMDSILDTYKNGAATWAPVLRNYALGLFGILATIEACWTGIKLAFKGADLGEFLAELINRILFIGFFLWLLLNSGDFATAIIDSFRQAGNAAAQAGGGSTNMRPGNIFEAGMDMANLIFKTDTGWGLEQMGEKIALYIAGIILVICFALMTAFMILALVESYIVMSAGTLLMGFGGSRWTKDFATKTLTYAVSVGAKLFVIQLLVGLAETMVMGWSEQLGPQGPANGMEDIMVMIGASLVMVALTKTIPDTVQGIINGVSPGGGGALTAAVAALAGAGASAAVGLAGAGAAAGSAGQLASEQIKAAGGSTGGIKGAAAMGGQALKNLGGAMKSDLGAQLSGQAHRGTMGGRMAADMGHQASKMQAAGGGEAAGGAAGGGGSSDQSGGGSDGGAGASGAGGSDGENATDNATDNTAGGSISGAGGSEGGDAGGSDGGAASSAAAGGSGDGNAPDNSVGGSIGGADSSDDSTGSSEAQPVTQSASARSPVMGFERGEGGKIQPVAGDGPGSFKATFGADPASSAASDTAPRPTMGGSLGGQGPAPSSETITRTPKK